MHILHYYKVTYASLSCVMIYPEHLSYTHRTRKPGRVLLTLMKLNDFTSLIFGTTKGYYSSFNHLLILSTLRQIYPSTIEHTHSTIIGQTHLFIIKQSHPTIIRQTHPSTPGQTHPSTLGQTHLSTLGQTNISTIGQTHSSTQGQAHL